MQGQFVGMRLVKQQFDLKTSVQANADKRWVWEGFKHRRCADRFGNRHLLQTAADGRSTTQPWSPSTPRKKMTSCKDFAALAKWSSGAVEEQWSSVAALLVLNLYRNTAGLHGKHVFGFVNSSCLYQWDFNPNYWHHKWVKTAGILQFWITQVDGRLEQGHKAHMPCLPFLR